ARSPACLAPTVACQRAVLSVGHHHDRAALSTRSSQRVHKRKPHSFVERSAALRSIDSLDSPLELFAITGEAGYYSNLVGECHHRNLILWPKHIHKPECPALHNVQLRLDRTA